MIISFIQTKGGTGKTTLAKCLAYSKPFQKAFGSIALVELDPQGTLYAWHEQREKAGLKEGKVEFVSLAETDPDKMQKRLTQLFNDKDAMILDVPGESVGKFATRFATALSDLVLIPMRSSTNDEQSFIDNILPVVVQTVDAHPEKTGSFYIIPTFVHPQSNMIKIRDYFLEIVPAEVSCLKSCLPHRSVFENFSRDGMNLYDYARMVKSNSRYYEQARKAIGDIEKLAKEILKKRK